LESLNLVSAIIPARNEEASIARAVESVAAQPEIGEVIVVNDQSTDRTGEILAELAARTPKLRVLVTDALPAGWTGKNYAVSIGAAAATGDWLLFTDADTYHLPGSTRRALSDAAEYDAVLVSYSPEQEMETFWERALIPRVYWMLSRRYSFANVNNPVMPDAAANGQFLLIRRDAYATIGGHTAVANYVLEDVALARRVKQAGLGLYFASGRGIVRTRMYRSFGAMWEGWTKNLYPLIGSSVVALAGELSGCAAMAGLIFILSQKIVNPIGWMIAGACVAALLTRFGEYVLFLRRNLLPLSLIQYYVPGVCLYTAALIASWWKNTRGSVVWKGRAYPARTP
jgi:cellulose synthase/poly-beta-1,6-N-acetylglucosamine synthase-like glycosyltransferase